MSTNDSHGSAGFPGGAGGGADPVALTFRSMMRRVLREEQSGEDTLGRTVELHQAWTSHQLSTEELQVELRRLHGEQPDLDDPQVVAEESAAICHAEFPAARPGPAHPAAMFVKFRVNLERLRSGEITLAKFREVMGDDYHRVHWLVPPDQL